MLAGMWRPKIRRQRRGTSTGSLDAQLTGGAWGWKFPRGVKRANQREVMHALDEIPADFGWDWARDRLVPVLERPGADPMPDDPQLSAVAACGIGYGFGIDIGVAFTRVNESLAALWDRDERTIRDVVLANLRRRIHDEDPSFEVPDDPGGALVVRALTTPDGMASSVLILPDVLVRIFGRADQVFTAPNRSLVLAFPVETPPEAIAEVSRDAERLDPHPLGLEPFRLIDGRLTWDGSREVATVARPLTRRQTS